MFSVLPAKSGYGFGDFFAFGFDEVEEFFGGAGVFVAFGVWVDGFEVVVFLFDGFALDGPASLAVGALRQQAEKVGEFVDGEGFLLSDFDVGEVVIPCARPVLPASSAAMTSILKKSI